MDGWPESRFATLMSSSIFGQCTPCPPPMSRQELRSAAVACTRRGYHASGTAMVRPSVSPTVKVFSLTSTRLAKASRVSTVEALIPILQQLLSMLLDTVGMWPSYRVPDFPTSSQFIGDRIAQISSNFFAVKHWTEPLFSISIHSLLKTLSLGPTRAPNMLPCACQGFSFPGLYLFTRGSHPRCPDSAGVPTDRALRRGIPLRVTEAGIRMS